MADKFYGGFTPGATGSIKSPEGEEIPVGLPTGEIGGDRRYKGATLGRVELWKCPACGADNTGDLARGCTACGSGSAAPRHVGVPPPSRQPTFTEEREEQPATRNVIDGFKEWATDRNLHLEPDLYSLLLDAWTSAIGWYLQQGGTQPGVNEQLVKEHTRIIELSTGMISVPRTLLNEVVRQLENTIDTDSGEQSDELLALISRLRELIDGGTEQDRGATES